MKKLKVTRAAITGALFGLAPLSVFAQGNDPLFGLINKANQAINGLIPLVIGLAVLVFLWGVLNYVISKGEADKGAARAYMIWGLVGLFVMVSVWGLVNLIGGAIFGSNNAIHKPPTAPGVPPPAGRSGGGQSSNPGLGSIRIEDLTR